MFPSTAARRLPDRFLGMLLATWLAGAEAPPARPAEGAPRPSFDLPAGAADAALLKFSVQSGQQVIFPTDLVKGVRTREVKGEYPAGEALSRMLDGTSLAMTLDPFTSVFAIIRRPPATAVKQRPGSHAIVIVGLSADSAQAERLHQQAEKARNSFATRGIPAGAIAVIEAAGDGPVRRESVLAALGTMTAPIDETWVLLLGQAANGRDGQPAFQVSGPRLSAPDLAAAIATLPGKKFVIVATTRSGGFLTPLLAVPQVEAVAATAAAGEINEPRFSQMWIDALGAMPEAGFRELAVDASGRVETFYRTHNLAQGEHAELIDRATGKLIEAPFAPDAATPTPGHAP